MRTLLMMRHAKSDWSKPGLGDHERPLNPRGRRAAAVMAAQLNDHSLQADVILGSSAVRVQQTIQLLQDTWSSEAPLLTEPSLYLASAQEIAKAVEGLHDSWTTAMLVGHNPGIAAFISWLSQQELEMPTAAIAVFTSRAASWYGFLKPDDWQLHAYWKPRDIVGK